MPFVLLEEITAVIKYIASILFRIILGIIIFLILAGIMKNFLPDDPFREGIISFSLFMLRYTKVINVFIPLRLMVSSLGFAVAWRYGMRIFQWFWSAADLGDAKDLSA